MPELPQPTLHKGNPFDYAKEFVHDNVFSQDESSGLVRDNAEKVADLYESNVRPALELQAAAFFLMQGPNDSRSLLPSTFAFAIIDHLIMGWNSLLLSHSRVACSIMRLIAEASIFEIAASIRPDEFAPVWRSRSGTGGAVLRLLDKQLPPLLDVQLRAAWDGTVAFAHASETPTAWSIHRLSDPALPNSDFVTFGGPYLGPLPRALARTIAAYYAVLSEVSTAAMALAFSERLKHSPWFDDYSRYIDPVESRWRKTPGIEHYIEAATA
jgi:hypothetical protein